ncbi:MAG: symmetrical bis(5'-nucleosyl)-tetraphosphatase [Myxococcales bacterium]|nr:symmetrical bis(5'-nucleosyl)-tetraphosphatase [Myxococcales bacterium]
MAEIGPDSPGADYAVGDLQGCFEPLQRLLHALDFDHERDRLWLLGDLVNRGPASLSVLRFVQAHRSSVGFVLGNHDLHLLARAAGTERKAKDTLDDILTAPDRDALVDLVRRGSLLIERPGYVMLHAGLHPSWSLGMAREIAAEASHILSGDRWAAFVLRLRGAHLDSADPFERLAARVGILTRVRAVDGQNEPVAYTGPLDTLPQGCRPWWHASNALRENVTWVMGHWSALGSHSEPGIQYLDTGCVWGRELTAMCLQDRRLTSVSAYVASADGAPHAHPHGHAHHPREH